jgi:hypothetical protein
MLRCEIEVEALFVKCNAVTGEINSLKRKQRMGAQACHEAVCFKPK